jgi:leucine-rich PPR motif-containing protein
MATVKAGRIDDEYSVFREMLSNGITPGVVAYNTILHGLFQTERLSKAKELYLNMINNETKWDIYTYNIILNGLCKNNCLDEAFKMF